MSINEETLLSRAHAYALTAIALLALCAAPWMGPLTVWADTLGGTVGLHPTQSLFAAIDFLPQLLGLDTIALLGMAQLIAVLLLAGAKSPPTVGNQWGLTISASLTVLTVAGAIAHDFERDPIGAPALSLLIALGVAVTASRNARRLSAASRAGGVA